MSEEEVVVSVKKDVLSDEIRLFLSDRESTSIKELYDRFPTIISTTIRGTVNYLVKRGKIKRISHGVYGHL